MKIIYNRILPFGKNFLAINLFGILFAKGPCNRVIINHETIHTAQIRECGYIFFYILYVAEWIIRLFIYRSSFDAYRNLSFEREAYDNQTDPDYLSQRHAYAWLRYMYKKPRPQKKLRK